MFFPFQNEEKTKPPAVTNFWKNMCGGGGEFFPSFIPVLIFPSFVAFPNIFCGAFYFTGILTMIILLKVVLIGHGPTVSLVKALHRESPIVNSTPKVEHSRRGGKITEKTIFNITIRPDQPTKAVLKIFSSGFISSHVFYQPPFSQRGTIAFSKTCECQLKSENSHFQSWVWFESPSNWPWLLFN